MEQKTIGKRIAELRRQKSMTQEFLAEKLGVSTQAVSKWENDLNCPDIGLLPDLAKLLGVSVDLLLSGEAPLVVQLKDPEKKMDFSKLLLRILICSGDGDEVKVNLPCSLLKLISKSGMKDFAMINGAALDQIDFEQVFQLVEKGVIGNLVDITTKNGDQVKIVVEER